MALCAEVGLAAIVAGKRMRAFDRPIHMISNVIEKGCAVSALGDAVCQ